MSTRIAWTQETWNPVTGCSRVSEGCRHCYAEALSLKWGWTRHLWTAAHAADNVRCHADRLEAPRRWRAPRRIFVNSMSDLFHDQVPDDFLRQVFAVMAATPRHTYQILTKRPDRAATWPGPWPKHVWMGTSVEDRRALPRLDALRGCPAAVRFVSAEPLLEDLGALDLAGIDQVIVGGESGPKRRPMDMAWARAVRDACVAQDVAFFFKQDSAARAGTRPWLVEPDGTRWTWHQYPGELTPPAQLSDAAVA